jgi:integrase
LPREALVIEELVARFIGDLPLRSIHVGRLQPFIAARRAKGNKNRTINYGLQVVRHILNLAANEWIDEHGLTWLEHAPKIRLLREDDKREPYPLSWDEQERLFSFLPQHLRQMALFTVNTGSRDQEVCNLRWEWEIDVPALNTSVFIVPKHRVKNREDRLVVLNRVAKALIEEVRGIHSDYVFSYRGKRLQRMRSHGWLTACAQAGLSHVRVHDLKHTFGRRLRAAGVSFEDRQVYRPVENRGGWRLKSAAPMS